MKNLLLIAVSLCTTVAFSQLYVSPNASSGTDSYVYVKDQVLFVEQDINLVENSSGATEASIYLREESQLVQGTTSSPNSGDGYISVIQNSHSDAYDYNFWISPVGNYATASGNENFGMARVHDSLSLTNSNPATIVTNYNGSANPLRISRRWLYQYPAGGPWTAIGTANVVAPGYGFSMKGVGVSATPNQNYDFRGRANNGDITVNILEDDLTLSGNPYPSALDLNAVFHDASNTSINSFRYWDEDRSINSHYYVDNKGGFGVWVPGTPSYDGSLSNPGIYTRPMFMNYDNDGNPTTTTGVQGTHVERRFAPIAQGFMIQGDPGTGNSTATLKNSHRLYRKEGAANNSTFRTTAGNTAANKNPNNSFAIAAEQIVYEDPRLPQIRINAFMNESHMRQLVLAFSDDATDGYDRGFDGLSPMDASSEVFFPIGPTDNDLKPYVIQGVSFDESKRIPITFELSEPTSLVLTAIEEIKMNNTEAYLFDNLNTTWKQITGDRTAHIQLDAGTYTSRFYIVFIDGSEEVKQGTTQTQEHRATVLANVDFFQNNPAQQLEVSNPEGYDIKAAHVFDMSGKLVINESNVGVSKRFTFPTGNLSDGIYLVKLTTKDDVVIDYKVSIKN
tara:strand:+ start:46419 stop:48278 length:1860 start_codon:yes stop_codon:yes gene_type:complete